MCGYWRYADGQGEFPLVAVRDRAGHVIDFEYAPSGEPVSVTHSAGHRVRVTMAGDRVAGLSLADGSLEGVPLVRYSYDETGQLTEIINSSGQPLRLSYDDAGRLAGYIDRNATRYLYTYDSLGRCVRGDSPSGTLSAAYEYRDGATLWTNAVGGVTRYTIDGSARIAAVTDPLGGVTTYTHDSRGRVVSETDPLGRASRYAYDHLDNMVSVTRPDDAVARAAYDDRCQPVELIEPGRGVWRQDFDDLGNRTALTQPDGSVVRYTYDDAGHLATVTGPDGAVTAVACDTRGLPVSVTGPDGAVTRYERDRFGRVGRLIDAAGAETVLTWTVEGRPLSRTYPDGSSETWAWDAEGNLLRHVSPGGAVSACEYGPFGKVTSVIGPDGAWLAFGYDAELRLSSVTHGGLTWSYTYDAAGRVIGETDYNGASTRYEVDAAGQLVRRVNAVGQEVRYTYDALGNIASERAGDETALFEYDAAGHLVLARNASTEVAFEYDRLGRVTAETCDGRTVTSSYDAAGRVASRGMPSGAATTWSYDEAGRPAMMRSGGQELRFGHGADGRETRRELPGGVTLAQDWDVLGRLTGQVLTGSASSPGSPTMLQRRSYTYNPDGFVTGLEDLMTGSRAFGLDASGRVRAVSGAVTGTGAEWTEHYTYDPAGNIASAAWPAVPPELAGGWLDATPQGERSVAGTLLRRAGNIRYRHDAAGRVVQRTRTRISRKPETWRYEWDADNRLTAVVTPDGSTWRYKYDPLGRRVLKQRTSADGTVLAETRFTWDGLVLTEQAELLASGEYVTTWDYEPGTFRPLTQSSRTSLRTASQEVIDAEFYSIVTDLTGTPSELIAPDGALVGFQQHTLWGGTFWHPEGASTPLRFPGQYADDETGLHYNNQRYYDPVSGTYLSPDPLGLSPAPNPHAYVGNPHVLIDPLGLAPDVAYEQIQDPGLRAQVKKVINYWDKTRRTPSGVMQGGKTGYAKGVYTNDAGLLPKRPLNYYTESDVWPSGGVNRGGVRLVFGRKGEIYLSENHYRSFTRLR